MNNAAEKASLADAAYSPGTAPPGWNDVSNDPQALQKYGITPSDLDGSRPGGTQLYEPDPTVFGSDQKATVAFQGSGMNVPDWQNNAAQALNLPSSYYSNAVWLGKALGNSVDYTGHSLGGGLGSAAATAGGGEGYTFNASGLNSGTVPGYGGTPQNPYIEAYQVQVAAHRRAVHRAPAPSRGEDLPPRRHELQPGWTPQHLGCAQGDREQKAAAQNKVADSTGKKC